MRLRKMLLVKLVALAGILASASAKYSCAGETDPPASLEISVDTSRPIAAALDLLEQRHGVAITYEEPRYVHESDLADVTEEVRRDSGGNHEGTRPRVLVPRAGRLHVSYLMRNKTSKLDDIAAVIRLLLEAHAEQRLPGAFRMERTGSLFHVVPIAVKGEDGSLVEAGSVLDAKIDFAKEERTGLETLEAICAAVRKVTGEDVTLGMAPLNLLIDRRVSVGASDETARAVLVRVLAGIKPNMSWRLFYSPSSLKCHLLNLYVVPEKHESTPGGG